MKPSKNAKKSLKPTPLDDGNEPDTEDSDTEDQGDTGLEDEVGKLAMATSMSLYELPAQDAAVTEILIQQEVSMRFFRLLPGMEMKANAKSREIYEKLKKLPAVNDAILLSPKENYGKQYSKEQAGEIAKLLPHKIRLDGYSARSVIIALAKFLREKHCLPTAVYTIGNSDILCVSNNTNNLTGNVNLQAINDKGEVVDLPFVYGDGNGKPQNSLYYELRNIAEPASKKNVNISEFMQYLSNKIQASPSRFLDQLVFLRSIIEVVRYLHPASPLDKQPIAVAQARSTQLLIEKKLELHQVYGMDENEEFYKKTDMVDVYGGKKESMHSICKSPYGPVTGKNIAGNVGDVHNKIKRINSKHNEQYSNHPGATGSPLVEGYNLVKKSLVKEYGSGGESSHDDYSDDDKKVKPLRKFVK